MWRRRFGRQQVQGQGRSWHMHWWPTSLLSGSTSVSPRSVPITTVPCSARRQKHWGFPGAWMSLNSRVRCNFRFLILKQFLRGKKKNQQISIKEALTPKRERTTVTEINGHPHTERGSGSREVVIRTMGVLFHVNTPAYRLHSHFLKLLALHGANLAINLQHDKSRNIIKW